MGILPMSVLPHLCDANDRRDADATVNSEKGLIMNRKTSFGRSMAMAMAVALASAAFAGTIGFEEDFALAPDRNVPLNQLIAGTEDFYYYTTLNQQNAGQLDAADKTIAAWLKQLGRTDRVREMENRQALLKYKNTPQASLNYLTGHLGLTYSHERETAARQAALPHRPRPQKHQPRNPHRPRPGREPPDPRRIRRLRSRLHDYRRPLR